MLHSPKGYLIKPFVKLVGLTNGYIWSPKKPGLWRSFMETNKRYYTSDNTGRSNKSNPEGHVAKAFYDGDCARIDTEKIATHLGMLNELNN